MSLGRFLLSRLGLLFAVLFVVTFTAFAAMNILGDPLFNIFGPALEQAAVDPVIAEQVADAEEQFHLNDPLPVRYVKWLGDVATGDFGRSYSSSEKVSTIIARKLPVTMVLAIEAQLIALLTAIPWAIFSARRAGGKLDTMSTGLAFLLIALPNFCLAVLLKLMLNIKFQVFDLDIGTSDGLGRQLWHMLPASLALGIGLAATYQRLLRTDLVTTLQEDFVLMAKAKGMPARHILWRHALRPSMFSFITVFALNTGALIGGTLVIERIFSIKGLGDEIAEAVIRDDYPLVLASLLIIATAYVLVTTIADLLYTFLDPRVNRG